MKLWRKILILLLIALVCIQFVRLTKNNDTTIGANDITSKFVVPPNVDSILKASCYDCHSNNTVYPWYWNIQPVAWFMNGHIADAKRALNFSTFTAYSAAKQYKEFDHISGEVKRGDMPISSYTLIHRYATLNDSQKQAINDWTDTCRKQMEGMYPADSLVSKGKGEVK